MTSYSSEEYKKELPIIWLIGSSFWHYLITIAYRVQAVPYISRIERAAPQVLFLDLSSPPFALTLLEWSNLCTGNVCSKK